MLLLSPCSSFSNSCLYSSTYFSPLHNCCYYYFYYNNDNTCNRSRASLLHFRNNNLYSLLRPKAQSTSSSSSSSSSSVDSLQKSTHQDPRLRFTGGENSESQDLVSSAAAVAAAIRKTSTSPVEIAQRIEKGGKSGIVLPSPDFQRLCVEQLDLFLAVVDPNAILSVYVRPAGSYVMDRLELRRVTLYPGLDVAEAADIVILIGNFAMPTGLRATEATLSNYQVQVIPECSSVVFPLVKHPFVVGFLVAELPMMESGAHVNAPMGQGVAVFPSPDETYSTPLKSDLGMREIQPYQEEWMKKYYQFTVEQSVRAIKISHSLAMAYVMDQKAMLLQQSSWQNNIRMSDLVGQIRGSLSTIRTLSEMLSVQMKRSETSYDIVNDILIQGDRMKDALQQLQDAVYLTKANIMRYNEDALRKLHNSPYGNKKEVGSQFSGKIPRDNEHNSGREIDRIHPLSSSRKDLQMPMPPLTLVAPRHINFRPCNASDVLTELVDAAIPLARRQQRSLQLTKLSSTSQVSVEESALRQALSNLIEGALLRTHVSGHVEIILTEAPAGGSLIVINDDGPDMNFMTQMHSLMPFGADLCSDGMVEDNMTWNFVAGLTVACEILECYGCVVRVVSPRSPDAALGTGGTRIELWIPDFPSDLPDHSEGGEKRLGRLEA